MKSKILSAAAAALFAASFAILGCSEEKAELSKSELADKIKGGWAGQIIGCTYGGPTEWKYQHRTMPDSEKIK